MIGAVKAVLPTLNADGNEIGGIHSVLEQAPLGTYTGWNIVKSGFRKGQFLCSDRRLYPLSSDRRGAFREP